MERNQPRSIRVLGDRKRNGGDDRRRLREWIRGHRRLTASVLAFALAAVFLAAYHFTRQNMVYVTDGSYVFNNNLRSVEEKIKAENEWVDRSGKPYVSVVVVATMTPQPSVEPLDPTRTRHGIEGAYLAQYANNHPGGPGSRPDIPLVKLLLSDEGSQEANWAQVVSRLEGLVSTDHLVAVTGLGISVANTTKLISRLDAGPQPPAMVGSVLTGDKFSNMRGLVLVSPPNSAQASAAARFLGAIPNLPRQVNIWMVADKNPADGYARSLATAFRAALPGTARSGGRTYAIAGRGTTFVSDPLTAPTVLSQSNIGDPICKSDDSVVYFAGRGVDLQAFLTGLADRYCAASHPLTVLTGSDGSRLIGERNLWPSAANLTVYYTALASPAIWSLRPRVVAPTAPAWFDQYRYGFTGMFPGESLDDSWAIMFHDAVLTAVQATDQLYSSNGNIPSAALVAGEINQLPVPGASGYICFNDVNEPSDKEIPIVELSENGKLHFVRLSSASGAAPTADSSCST